MTYKFTIQGRLDGLNEYTSSNRTNPHVGGRMKRDNEDLIIWSVKNQLRGIKIDEKINIHYKFYEKNRRRDKDNIAATAMKFVQDALVKAGTIKDDGWNEIEGFTQEFYVDKNNPRIEITLEEVGG